MQNELNGESALPLATRTNRLRLRTITRIFSYKNLIPPMWSKHHVANNVKGGISRRYSATEDIFYRCIRCFLVFL